MPYDLPNLSIENGPAKAHVRIGWLRSVANIYHGFGIQCFTDELAHRAHRDPYEYLLDLIDRHARIDFKNVEYPNYGLRLKLTSGNRAAASRHRGCRGEIRWAKKKSVKGHGFGIAAHKSFLTYVATVVEVEVNDQGKFALRPRLTQRWTPG